MKLVHSPFKFRHKNHINTRLEIRGERIYQHYVVPWFMLALIIFCFLDKLNVPHVPLWFFFLFRTGCTLLSYCVFYLSRGRLPYAMRAFLTGSFYVYCVEFIMIYFDLLDTAYFGALFLTLVCAITMFPLRFGFALALYTGYLAPVIILSLPAFFAGNSQAINVVFICLEGILVYAFISTRVRVDQVGRLFAAEALTRDLGKRSAEVKKQAEELLKRKIFERQFSPQVVQNVLQTPEILQEVRQYETVTLVVDIEDSTRKADTLAPRAYREVIEEVIDLFSACCLKNNITIDKFTGDGFLAFAGAPVSSTNDLLRTLQTCYDLIQMLKARKSYLDLRWGSPLNMRFAVCQGNALVGFLGTGSYRNFSAIGRDVSAAFRIASVPEPWHIAVVSTVRPIKDEISKLEWATIQPFVFENLKGFEDKKIPGSILILRESESSITDFIRCPNCQTLMIETYQDAQRLVCPACSQQKN